MDLRIKTDNVYITVPIQLLEISAGESLECLENEGDAEIVFAFAVKMVANENGQLLFNDMDDIKNRLSTKSLRTLSTLVLDEVGMDKEEIIKKN